MTSFHPRKEISTRDLSMLPGIEELKSLSQSLAVLDAILCPEWQYRCHSFNAHWSEGEQMASMRDGSGDEYFILFTKAGAVMKGFAHEAAMSPYASDPPHVWQGVLDDVPAVFADFLTEPTFSIEDTTFCIWRAHEDGSWQIGNIAFPVGEDPDGSKDLLATLDGNPRTYQEWAEEYYEQPVALAAVRHIYEQRPLVSDIVERLNPDLTLEVLKPDIEEIGYGGRNP